MQFNFGNLGPPLSGAQLVDDNLEPWRDALHSLHSGSSRPSYAVAGMMWIDTTTNPWVLKVFDGTDDITLGTINTSTNIFAPSFGAGSLVNADISASAAIALSKLATLSNNRAVVTNGSGNLSAATTTATEIGYLNGVTSNIQTQLDGKLASGNYITALTGDGTATGPGSVALTLATVNSNVGAFGSSTAIPSVTVNAKGLVTAVSTNAVVAPAGTLSGSTLSSGVTNSSLTSVGTIGTGTWQGTAITNTYIDSGLSATKIGNGSVSNTEFQYLDGVTSSIQTQINGKAAKSQTLEGAGGMIGGDLENKDYRVFLKMPHAGTITETTTRCASGTATATFKINTTALGGTTNSVSTSEQSRSHSSSNAFSAGDDIVITISSNSSCADMSFMVKYTRSLS